jgi:hypothetical protein
MGPLVACAPSATKRACTPLRIARHSNRNLRRGQDVRPFGFNELNADPMFDPLRADPASLSCSAVWACLTDRRQDDKCLSPQRYRLDPAFLSVGVGWTGYLRPTRPARSLARSIACLVDHERQNATLRGAEGHAHSDFGGALADGRRQYPVQTARRRHPHASRRRL